jgi:hypothetical protein
VVEGQIRLGGASIDTWPAAVKVPPAHPLNPPVDQCHCGFTNDPEFHDQLIGMESMTVPYAAELVALVISDDDPGTGVESMFDSDPYDFGHFVARQNWADPVGMAQLAERVTYATNQAWRSPPRIESRRERHAAAEQTKVNAAEDGANS